MNLEKFMVFLAVFSFLSVFLSNCSVVEEDNSRFPQVDATSERVTDREKDDLKGPVNVCIEEYIVYVQKFDEWKEKKRSLQSRSVYDREGNLAEYIVFSADKIRTQKIHYATDLKREEIITDSLIAIFAESGVHYNTTLFSYDSSDRLIEQATYNWQGFLVDKTTTTYDKNGNLLETIYYGEEEVVESRMQYFYDNRGNEISFISKDTDGAIQYKTRSKYDNKNRVLEYIFYSEEEKYDYKFVYAYNAADDDYKEKLYYNSDAKLESRERYNYNEAGNVKELLNFDADNNLESRYEFALGNKDLPSTFEKYREDGSVELRSTYEYKFDSHDNMVRFIKMREDFSDDSVKKVGRVAGNRILTYFPD